jgi:hypothetical protein
LTRTKKIIDRTRWFLTRLAIIAGLLPAMMAGCSNAPVASSTPMDLAILQSWSGVYPVAELKRLPEGQQKSAVGYLGNAAVFKSVWASFKPGEDPPEIDFSKNIVVFHRNVNFYNRTSIFKVTLKDGMAEVLAIETLSAMPIEDKVAMAMAAIPRANVKFIQTGKTRIPVNAN